jgi:hypothetical protein
VLGRWVGRVGRARVGEAMVVCRLGGCGVEVVLVVVVVPGSPRWVGLAAALAWV